MIMRNMSMDYGTITRLIYILQFEYLEEPVGRSTYYGRKKKKDKINKSHT